MVKLIPVDPAEISTERLGRRGRVSYPIIKQFLEMGVKVCKADLTGLEKNPAYMRSVLQSYITNHNLPIKVFSIQGDLHLMRLDIDNEGNEIPNWREQDQASEGSTAHLRSSEPTPINSEEVKKRFRREKGKSTK